VDAREVLEFPGSVDGPWARYVHNPDERGIGTVRYGRLVPNSEETARQLAKRTLTTSQPASHLAEAGPSKARRRRLRRLLSDNELLAGLLTLNLERAGDEGAH
jgi:hypothetical protein